jgi:hypothetical protein
MQGQISQPEPQEAKEERLKYTEHKCKTDVLMAGTFSSRKAAVWITLAFLFINFIII